MARNNKFIEALINSGADAFDNMYDIYIVPPGGEKTVMTVRATGFDVPDASVGEYEKEYHGTKMKFPKPQTEFNREFTIEFRYDAAYNLHDFFLQWQSAVVNPKTGGVANVAAYMGSVIVRTIDTMYVATKDGDNSLTKSYTDDTGEIKESDTREWRFDDVWVKKVGQPKFKTKGGEVMTFTVEFRCGDVDYKGY